MDFNQHQADDELISGVQAGSDKAFTLIYKKYEGKLMGYLIYKLRNREIAEEIFQISWSKVIDNVHRYKFDETFSGWLFKIAGNSVKDWFKKSSNQTKLLESYGRDLNCPDEKVETFLNLEFLKLQAKKIIELQYIYGKTSKEISKELSLSESNVRKISSRAKQQIKNHILKGGSLS